MYENKDKRKQKKYIILMVASSTNRKTSRTQNNK